MKENEINDMVGHCIGLRECYMFKRNINVLEALTDTAKCSLYLDGNLQYLKNLPVISKSIKKIM